MPAKEAYRIRVASISDLMTMKEGGAQGATNILYSLLYEADQKGHGERVDAKQIAMRAEELIKIHHANPIAIIQGEYSGAGTHGSIFQYLVEHATHDEGWREIVRVFLANGAPVNISDKDNTSLIHIAARAGDLDLLDLLIDYGANVNAKTKPPNLYTPLFCAADSGNESINEGDPEAAERCRKVCQRLLDEGAYPYHVVKVPTGYGSNVGTIPELVPFLDHILHENQRRAKQQAPQTDFWKTDNGLTEQIYTNLAKAINEYASNHQGDYTAAFLQQYILGKNPPERHEERRAALERYQQIGQLLSAETTTSDLDKLCRPLCEDVATGQILSELIAKERTQQRTSRKAVGTVAMEDPDVAEVVQTIGSAVDKGKKFVARVGRREALTGALGLAVLAMGFANEQQAQAQDDEQPPRDKFIERVHQIMRHSEQPMTDEQLGALYDSVASATPSQHSRMVDMAAGAAAGHVAHEANNTQNYVGESVESVVKYLTPAIEGIVANNAPHHSGFQEIAPTRRDSKKSAASITAR